MRNKIKVEAYFSRDCTIIKITLTDSNYTDRPIGLYKYIHMYSMVSGIIVSLPGVCDHLPNIL